MLIIISIIVFAAGDAMQGTILSDGSDIVTMIGVALLVVTAIIVVFIVFYYRAVLSLIGGIRSGIIRNTLSPLPGVTLFTVFTAIIVAFTALSAISAAAATGYLNEMSGSLMDGVLSGIPSEYQGLFDSYTDDVFGSPLEALIPLVRSAGTAILLVVLGQFNNKLKISGNV
jgi:hypothetical protein